MTQGTINSMGTRDNSAERLSTVPTVSMKIVRSIYSFPAQKGTRAKGERKRRFTRRLVAAASRASLTLAPAAIHTLTVYIATLRGFPSSLVLPWSWIRKIEAASRSKRLRHFTWPTQMPFSSRGYDLSLIKGRFSCSLLPISPSALGHLYA